MTCFTRFQALQILKGLEKPNQTCFLSVQKFAGNFPDEPEKVTSLRVVRSKLLAAKVVAFLKTPTGGGTMRKVTQERNASETSQHPFTIVNF